MRASGEQAQANSCDIPLLTPTGGWSLKLDTRYKCPNDQPNIRIQHLFLQARRSFAVFRYTDFPR